MKGIAIVLILSISAHALRTEGKQSFLQQDEMAGETYSYSYSYSSEDGAEMAGEPLMTSYSYVSEPTTYEYSYDTMPVT